MKKVLVAFSIVALAITAASPAVARNRFDQGLHLGWFKHEGLDGIGVDRFVLLGTIASKTSNSLTVNVQSSTHINNISNGQTTVVTDSNTKFHNTTLADLKAGDKAGIWGTISGSTLTATDVRLIAIHKHAKAYGEVTAKIDNSITVQNNLTGQSQTFTTNEDTKVKINGEPKTTVDIQVGDRGWVKFKNEVSGMVARFVSLFR